MHIIYLNIWYVEILNAGFSTVYILTLHPRGIEAGEEIGQKSGINREEIGKKFSFDYRG